jgi:pescadillo protein
MELMTTDGDDEKVKLMKEKHTSLNRLKNLFQNLKFFINREVPREPLVFIIRCFGGKVSWDKDSFVGATFDETDETITHQIVDRPSIAKQYISRDYIQPQWVFDSVNQGSLLPTNKYFLGAKLPPHLSPFANKFREENDYIPPEEKALRDPSLIITHEQSDASDNEEDTKQTEADINLALEKAYKEEKRIDAKESQNQKKDKKSNKEVQQVESDNNEEDEEINENDVADMLGNDSDSEEETKEVKSTKVEEKLDPEEAKRRKREEAKKKMAVKTGKVFKVDQKKEKRLNEQELKLRAKMVKSRHKKLYYKLLQKREFESKEAKLLEAKRKRIDAEKKDRLEKKNKLNKQKQKAGK